jgi:hypothetical protein
VKKKHNIKKKFAAGFGVQGLGSGFRFGQLTVAAGFRELKQGGRCHRTSPIGLFELRV